MGGRQGGMTDSVPGSNQIPNTSIRYLLLSLEHHFHLPKSQYLPEHAK